MNNKTGLPEIIKDSEDVLFRIWLYKSQNKWEGVIDLMRFCGGVFIDAAEALLLEDDYKVIRLTPRKRGRDVPEMYYPLIESRLLAPILTKSITPFAGHIFGSGKLVSLVNLRFKFEEKVIRDLSIISPAEFARKTIYGYREDWPDNYHQRRKVFLCHSSLDRRFVRKLAEELDENSINVWVDYNDILAGQDFIQRMEEGIRECDFVIVVLTQNFIKGPWANRELKMAITREVSENRITVIPLLKNECKIPDILKIKSYVDFRGKRFKSGMRKLVGDINKLP